MVVGGASLAAPTLMQGGTCAASVCALLTAPAQSHGIRALQRTYTRTCTRQPWGRLTHHIHMSF